MQQDLNQTLALLTHTPAALDALLRSLPPEWTRATEGENTWSAFDVILHLIHCEREDWLLRLRTILDFGDSRPFPPFDRWGEIRESQQRPIGDLLDEFARVRAENIAAVRALHLTPEQLALPGQHPGIGAVTLSQLLATWAAHDLNHLHQIARVMAHQYREAVGPWSLYLGVMQCNGHGA